MLHKGQVVIYVGRQHEDYYEQDKEYVIKDIQSCGCATAVNVGVEAPSMQMVTTLPCLAFIDPGYLYTKQECFKPASEFTDEIVKKVSTAIETEEKTEKVVEKELELV